MTMTHVNTRLSFRILHCVVLKPRPLSHRLCSLQFDSRDFADVSFAILNVAIPADSRHTDPPSCAELISVRMGSNQNHHRLSISIIDGFTQDSLRLNDRLVYLNLRNFQALLVNHSLLFRFAKSSSRSTELLRLTMVSA